MILIMIMIITMTMIMIKRMARWQMIFVLQTGLYPQLSSSLHRSRMVGFMVGALHGPVDWESHFVTTNIAMAIITATAVVAAINFQKNFEWLWSYGPELVFIENGQFNGQGRVWGAVFIHFKPKIPKSLKICPKYPVAQMLSPKQWKHCSRSRRSPVQLRHACRHVVGMEVCWYSR